MSFQNNQKKILFFLYLVFISLLLFPSLKYYEGNTLIFGVYSLSINCLLFISLFRQLMIFFLAFFTWLGFWFKIALPYSVNYFFNYELKTPNLSEAIQQYRIEIDIQILDNVLIELSILFLFISLIIFFYKKKKILFDIHSHSLKYNYFFYIIIISIFFISVLNYSLGIYQKGFKDLFFTNDLVSYVFKFFYYIVPNVIICEILKTSDKSLIDLKKSLIYFLILNFFLFTSMLSREFILYTSIFLCFFLVKNYKRFNYTYILKLFFSFILLSILNIHFSNEIRKCKNNLIDKNITYSNINLKCLKDVVKKKKVNYEEILDQNNIVFTNLSAMGGLILKRWVGIESVYIKKIKIDFLELIATKDKLSNKNFIPGIYYLIYNQNIYMMLFLSFFFITILNLINRFLLFYSSNDYLYLFFNYVIIYRVYHAGLALINTIAFIILILLLSITIKNVKKKYLKIN